MAPACATRALLAGLLASPGVLFTAQSWQRLRCRAMAKEIFNDYDRGICSHHCAAGHEDPREDLDIPVGDFRSARVNGCPGGSEALSYYESIHSNQNYAGCQNRTWSGKACRQWSQSDWHAPMWGRGAHNYCRNVQQCGITQETIWCFVEGSSKRDWEYCTPVGFKCLCVEFFSSCPWWGLATRTNLVNRGLAYLAIACGSVGVLRWLWLLPVRLAAPTTLFATSGEFLRSALELLSRFCFGVSDKEPGVSAQFEHARLSSARRALRFCSFLMPVMLIPGFDLLHRPDRATKRQREHLEETEMWEVLVVALAALLIDLCPSLVTARVLDLQACMVWSVFAWKVVVSEHRGSDGKDIFPEIVFKLLLHGLVMGHARLHAVLCFLLVVVDRVSSVSPHVWHWWQLRLGWWLVFSVVLYVVETSLANTIRAQQATLHANDSLKLTRRMLSGFCDAVVELGKDLDIRGDSRILEAMLNSSALVGRPFADIVSEDDIQRFLAALEATDVQEPTMVLCIHLRLRGAFQMYLPMQLFYVKCITQGLGENYLIGLVEDTLDGVQPDHFPVAAAAPRSVPLRLEDEAEHSVHPELQESRIHCSLPNWPANAPKLVLSGQRQFHVESANEQACLMLEVSAERLTGESLTEFMHDADFCAFEVGVVQTRSERRAGVVSCALWHLGPFSFVSSLENEPSRLPHTAPYWLAIQNKRKKLIVHCLPMPILPAGPGSTVVFQGKALDLRATCAAQAPYRILRLNDNMSAVASTTMLERAQEFGLRVFFPASDRIESWLATALELEACDGLECVLGAEFANWDIRPQTVWLQLRWPEPDSSKRDELLLAFIGSLTTLVLRKPLGTPPESEISSVIARSSSSAGLAQTSQHEIIGLPASSMSSVVPRKVHPPNLSL